MSYLDGRRSVFPEGGYDQILELFSLPPSQRNNMKRYQELKLKENLTTDEQNELNSLTVALQHYIISEERMNLFGDILINIKFFKEGVEPYIESKKLEFQAEVDKLNYRAEWQPGVQYYKNIVTSGGEGYIAKLDNINQPPPNTTYWGKIGVKGEKGDPSLNINFKGEYDPAMSYTLGDAVYLVDYGIIAKQNTKGNPPTNATYWELQTNQTLVSDTQPFDSRITGWIDTSL